MKIKNEVIKITILNPSKWPRTGLISAHFQNTLNTKALQIYDSENLEITAQIEPMKNNFYRVNFVAEDIPPLGIKNYFIKKRDPTAEFHLPKEGLLDGNDYYIENDSLRVVIEENGSITIMDRNSEHQNEEKCKEKVIIMGEELGCGSIWAEDSFYKYSNLHLFELLPFKEIESEIKYSLLEANDFRGTLQLNRILKSNPPITISSLITLDKGDNPVIKIKTSIKKWQTGQNLRVLFPCKLSVEKLEIIREFGIFCVWDQNKQRGLGIFTSIKDIELIKHKNEDLFIAITLNKQGEISDFNYAIVALKNPIDKNVKLLAEEFRTPLKWEIN